MSYNSEPFTPAGTVSRTVSASSASVALAKGSRDGTVLVSSLAANAVAFIEFGASDVSASATTSTPILPGTQRIFTVGTNVTHAAAIGSAGTLYFTVGNGL